MTTKNAKTPALDSTHEFKYLAIKNWDKFQSTKMDKPAPWFKDYADQTSDLKISRLSFFQRGVLQECRRIRTRMARNIYNDATWMSRQMYAIATDRPHVATAVARLIHDGFLVPTNQPLGYQEKEKEGEKEKYKKEKHTEKEPAKRVFVSSEPVETPKSESVLSDESKSAGEEIIPEGFFRAADGAIEMKDEVAI